MPTAKQFKIAPVERLGTKLIIPDGMSYKNAIELIMRQMRFEQEIVQVDARFDVSPYDGALALFRVLDDIYGSMPPAYATENTFFGKVKVNPKAVSVACGPNGQTVQVPWGGYTLPMLGADDPKQGGGDWTAHLDTEVHVEGNPMKGFSRAQFKIMGEIRRMYQSEFDRIVALVRKDLLENSLYRGKAFRLRLRDDDGESKIFPEINFMTVGQLGPQDLILPRVSADLIATNIFTPLTRTADLRRMQIPLRRGVLLGGPFGTGKTMTANIAAGLAQANGWTFVYVEDPRELTLALRFAKMYLPAVVFTEDIDRITSGERTQEMDQLLNVVDGVDGKEDEIMLVLTTNDVESINPALLRPGRLDAVIPVDPPDAVAARQLMRVYGRGLVDPEDSLIEAGNLLAGQVPAMIREAVERAKLSALKNSVPDAPIVITDRELAEIARGMRRHQELLAPRVPDVRSDAEKAAGVIMDGLKEIAATGSAELSVSNGKEQKLLTS